VAVVNGYIRWWQFLTLIVALLAILVPGSWNLMTHAIGRESESRKEGMTKHEAHPHVGAVQTREVDQLSDMIQRHHVENQKKFGELRDSINQIHR